MIIQCRKTLLILSSLTLLVVGPVLFNRLMSEKNFLYAEDIEDCNSSPEDPTQSGCQIWLRYSDLPDMYPKTTPINPKKAFTLMQEKQNDSNFVIIDVRTSSEFTEGHIENAINLDYTKDDFQYELRKLDPSKTYLIYGKKDGYSANAANRLEGHITSENVFYLSGGFDRWLAENLPTVN